MLKQSVSLNMFYLLLDISKNNKTKQLGIHILSTIYRFYYFCHMEMTKNKLINDNSTYTRNECSILYAVYYEYNNFDAGSLCLMY